jgi:tetratricopeptide (TPR) repeat protein
MKWFPTLLCAGFAAFAATPAGAFVTVFGGGLAEACAKAAFAGLSDAESIRVCDGALLSEELSAGDRAATFTNRGVMKLRRGELEDARRDFDAAIALAPKVGEAWLNRGAVDVGERRYRQGLEDIDKGIALGLTEPEKAYYDRGLAHEGLDDETSAYFDYQQAATLKPDWILPQQELLRFSVTRR